MAHQTQAPGLSRRRQGEWLTTTGLSCQGFPLHVHLPPHSATGTAQGEREGGETRQVIRQAGRVSPKSSLPCKTSRPPVGRGATDNALCLGHKEHCRSRAAGAGMRVRLPAPHTHSIPLAYAQSNTQMPPQSLTAASKGLSQSPHGSHFGLSPVPSCSGNSRSLTYVPVAGRDFSESLTTNGSNRCAGPRDGKGTRCLPHVPPLSLQPLPLHHHHPGIFLPLSPKAVPVL